MPPPAKNVSTKSSTAVTSAQSAQRTEQMGLLSELTTPIQRFQSACLKRGKAGLWLVLWLVLIDLGINLLFPYPTNSKNANSLEQYFEYGRSIEGKLDRMIGDSVDQSDPIIAAGWVDSTRWNELELPAAPLDGDDLLVSFYGMSFSQHVAQALEQVDEKVTARVVVGPSAPANHSFASFLADADGKKAEVAVFGVLASSVKRMGSLSGASWTPEHPAPYTYPYYGLDDEQNLVTVEPRIQTADDFVAAFNKKDERWQQLKQQMKGYDQSFDSLVFSHNVTDYSAIARLIRRGWAHRVNQLAETGLYDPMEGFNPDASEIQTLEVLLREFVQTAKAAGQRPIVLLINDQGYSDHLYQVLSPQLTELEAELDAEVISTHSIVSADDPSHFLEDSHFTLEANLEIATALKQMIRDR